MLGDDTFFFFLVKYRRVKVDFDFLFSCMILPGGCLEANWSKFLNSISNIKHNREFQHHSLLRMKGDLSLFMVLLL